MADCQRILILHGKTGMALGSTQTLTKSFLDDKDILGNICECGSEGGTCCNGEIEFENGCQINRWKWYSSDTSILTVDEGPNSTTLVTALKDGTATVTCNGYSHWYCDGTCGCGGDPEPEPEWRDSGTLRTATFIIRVYDPAKMKQYVVINGPSRVGIDQTVTLSATTLSSSETYAWASSDTSVATVAAGVVTPVKLGTVLIRATGDTSHEYSQFQVEVVGVAAPRVTVWGRSSIGTGEIITFLPSETCEEPTTWDWSTTGSLVGADGTYMGGGAGSGTVTAKSVKSGAEASFTANVLDIGTTFIAITAPNRAEIGIPVELKAEKKYAYGSSSNSSFSSSSSSRSSSSRSSSSRSSGSYASSSSAVSSSSASSSSSSSIPLPTFVWVSMNPATATIDRNTGLLTGVKEGSVTITCTADGITESYSIEIVQPSAGKTVNYTGDNVFEMSVDTSVAADLLCSCLPDGDTSTLYEWRTTNHFVAVVDESLQTAANTLTPVKAGTTNITIDALDCSKVTQPITVIPKQDAFVAIETDSVIFDLDFLGEASSQTSSSTGSSSTSSMSSTSSSAAPVIPYNPSFLATTINGTGTEEYTWKTIGTDPCGQFFLDSSFHPTRAGTVVIQATGKTTGAVGTATVQILLRESIYGHNNLGRTAVCPEATVAVTVLDMPYPMIVLTGKTVLGLGEKYEYTSDSDDVVGEYSWSDSMSRIGWQEDYDPADPEYFGATGYAHATKVGTTTVRATNRVDERPRTRNRSQLAIEVLDFAYRVTGKSALAVGASLTLTIEQGLGLPDETHTLTSDTPAIATVSGLIVTGVAAGLAVLRVKGDTTGIEKLYSIEVVLADVVALPVITYPTVLKVKPDDPETVTCAILNPDPEATYFGYWASSDPTVCDVSGDDTTCTLTPTAKGGTVTVIYSDLFDPTITASVLIYVPPQETPLLLTCQNRIVETQEATFTAATITNCADTYTWQSSNEWVATVAGGVVTAKNAGTCTISVQGDTSLQRASLLLRVYESFVTINGVTHITVGESETFTASTFGVTEEYDWYSSDHCRATVDSAGVVTGIASAEASTVVITAIGKTTKRTATWTATIVAASEPFLHSSTRAAAGSSSYNSSGSTIAIACYMSSSSSDHSSSWHTWQSSSSCSSDSDLGTSSCSWRSWSSNSSSSWKTYYPYQYSSSSGQSSWSSSGVSSWGQCDLYFVPETLDMQYVSVAGPNKVRPDEYPLYEVTGYNEGNDWFPCCSTDDGPYAWYTTGGLSRLSTSGEHGKDAHLIGVTAGAATVKATLGKHLALHECFTKFNVLRDGVINCAAACTDQSYLCQARALPVILACDCKADAEGKIDQWSTLMETIKTECPPPE